jgi:chitinase
MLAPTAISIYPATIRVAPGETVRLQATVTGGINREVQWSIQEGTPGGSVESAGATVQNGNVFMLASYKAPTAPGIYHVVVASAADQSRKAVVQIFVSYGFPHF